jgi:oxygen-independent coproporphyrinogen-3 oxidase
MTRSLRCQRQTSVGVYIHIPFCLSKCRYCSFNSYADLGHMYETYAKALEKEILLFGEGEMAWQAETVYLGGGTPTVLSVDLLRNILEACRERFILAEDAEISVEGNPGTVDLSYLRGLRELGVNRLSLGVQSFCDEMLALLGRVHSFGDAIEAYHAARHAGFDNINLDLIYALPTQTLAQWRTDLAQATALRPEHLSLYCLSLEEGTPLAEMVAAGSLPSPDSDLAADMYTWAEEFLENARYQHYEISNWATTGHECRHNVLYWRNRPYLGFGAGAHSFHGERRYHNVAAPAEYIRLVVAGGDTLGGSEVIDEALEISETMIMGLRLCEGVSLEDFEERFGLPLTEAYEGQIRVLVAQGLLDMNDRGLRLTPRGRLLGNEVFERFLPGSDA